MSKYKVHGKFGSFLKSIEMDRGDYSLERLRSKFGQILGFGVSVQYSSSSGQGAVTNDKQLEEAVLDSAKRGKYNVEVVLIKDGTTPKAVSAYQPTQKSVPTSSSSKTSSSSNVSSNNNNNNYSSSSSSSNKPVSPRRDTSSSSAPKSQGELLDQLKKEINKMRTTPNTYIKILEERTKAYDGQTLLVTKGDVKFKTKTHEGKAAAEEAINVLEKSGRLPSFDFPTTLSNCANEVANKVGTKPVDKNVFGNIIESHGTYNGELKLLRGYFYEHDDAQDLVTHFLVSDGDSNRTSRGILLSTSLKCGGIAIVEGNYPKLCTLMFVSEWK